MAHIAQDAHVWTAIQHIDPSGADKASVALMHQFVEAEVRKVLGYEPLLNTYTEFYPRESVRGGRLFRGVWDVNAAGTHAVMRRAAGARVSLQLKHLPVRSITNLFVDENARFGTAPNAFAAGTEWTEGEEFWGVYEESGLNESGLLEAAGAWPLEGGSVKAIYQAGYYRSEVDGDTSDSNYKKDATGLLAAVVTAMITNYGKWQAWKKKPMAGLVGPLQSERAQDYSYQMGQFLSQHLAMTETLPAESLHHLQDFIHYGRRRT